MIIDVDALRKYVLEEDYGAFFVGGFGGALAESVEIERASDEELVEITPTHIRIRKKELDAAERLRIAVRARNAQKTK